MHSRNDAATWYTYGAISALGHFAFVPFVAPLIRQMINRKEKAEKREDVQIDRVAERARDDANRRDQAKWLRVHAVRTFTVDSFAVLCFFKGLKEAYA